MWIVMTSSAKMPQSCWGRYVRVALVKLTQEYTAKNLQPKMISTRARGCDRVVDLGNFHAGKTTRCASARAIADAIDRAHQLNNTTPIATDELLMSWGGSA